MAFEECAFILKSRVSRLLVKTHALNALKVGPAVLKKACTCSISSLSPRTAPPRHLPCPSRYLVAEWMIISAPSNNGVCNAGVQKQLSTISFIFDE